MTCNALRVLPTAAIQLALLIAAGLFLALVSTVQPFLPGPLSVLRAGSELLSQSSVYAHFTITCYEALAGYAIAAAAGVFVGVAIGASRTLTEILNPMILSIYAVPKIIFLPFLMIVFGVGLAPKIANAALHAFFPVVLNALVGMREVDMVHKKVARSLFATRWQCFRFVYLPSMVLPVFAGLRLALGLAFMGALLAEFFQSNGGIGYLVHQFYNQVRIAEMLAVIFAVFLLIFSMNAATKSVENYFARWRTN